MGIRENILKFSKYLEFQYISLLTQLLELATNSKKDMKMSLCYEIRSHLIFPVLFLPLFSFLLLTQEQQVSLGFDVFLFISLCWSSAL